MKSVNLIICLFYVLCSQYVFAAEVDVKVVSHIREHGYFIGDIVEEVIDIQGPSGASLAEASLPRPGSGQWVELRDIHINRANKDSGQYQLKLHWQIFKAVRETRNIGLPAFSMTLDTADAALPVNVKERQVMVSQLLPVMLDPAQTELSDNALPQLRQLLIWQRYFSVSVALFAMSALWLLWRYDLPPFSFGRAGPFALACRSLSSKKSRHMEVREAFSILHHAINQSAGRAVFPDDLLGFLRNRDSYQSLASQLEGFYAESQRLFYAGAAPVWTVSQVRDMALRLRAIEKGHKS